MYLVYFSDVLCHIWRLYVNLDVWIMSYSMLFQHSFVWTKAKWQRVNFTHWRKTFKTIHFSSFHLHDFFFCLINPSVANILSMKSNVVFMFAHKRTYTIYILLNLVLTRFATFKFLRSVCNVPENYCLNLCFKQLTNYSHLKGIYVENRKNPILFFFLLNYPELLEKYSILSLSLNLDT